MFYSSKAFGWRVIEKFGIFVCVCVCLWNVTCTLSFCGCILYLKYRGLMDAYREYMQCFLTLTYSTILSKEISYYVVICFSKLYLIDYRLCLYWNEKQMERGRAKRFKHRKKERKKKTKQTQWNNSVKNLCHIRFEKKTFSSNIFKHGIKSQSVSYATVMSLFWNGLFCTQYKQKFHIDSIYENTHRL